MCRRGQKRCHVSQFLLALSCGVNNFTQEELYFDDFYFVGKNPETPLEPLEYCKYRLALYLYVLYIVAGISTATFALMKNLTIFAIFSSTKYLRGNSKI